MTRRGYQTVLQAVRLSAKKCTGKNAARWAESTKERVANRVMMGERVEDAWRNERQQIRAKRNPR